LHDLERGRSTFIGGAGIDQVFCIRLYALEDILKLRVSSCQHVMSKRGRGQYESRTANKRQTCLVLMTSVMADKFESSF
jgi:hypothetical protein